MQELLELLHTFSPLSVAFRLLLAAVLGGCIGAERGRHGRPAGLRTYILVSVGACITTMIGLYGVERLGFSGDPLRIGAQVVSGIGFLGVGTIISDRNANITGLTTAAGLWTTACVGLAVGIGFYLGAILAFLIMLVAIMVLSRLEKARKGSAATVSYYLEVDAVQRVNTVHSELADIGSLQIVPAKSGIPGHVGLVLSVETEQSGDALLRKLQEMDCVAVAIPTTL